MTKPNDTNTIKIQNAGVSITLPVTALQYYDKIVELAHLVVLGDAVPRMEVKKDDEDLKQAASEVRSAMLSGDPKAALEKLRDQLKARAEPPDRKDLKAEVIEKGEKPKDDPMVRIAEVAMKCAESVGMDVPEGTPVVSIIPAISRRTVKLQKEGTALHDLSITLLGEAGVTHTEEYGHTGTAKNMLTMGAGLKQHMGFTKGGWKAAKVLRDTMVVLGITVRERHNASLELCIGDCQEALSLAARRGHALKSGAEVVKS